MLDLGDATHCGAPSGFKAWLLTGMAVSAMPFATAAHAQSASVAAAPPTAVAAPAAGAVGQSVNPADIIVTARKQNERVSDVPVAIKAFTAKDLQRYATQSFSGLSTQVPGLTIGEGSAASNVNINLRGIGSGGGSLLVDQAISVNLDGLQVSRGNLLRLGFHDMERVEVLKGPQALFFGKNSPGGVISLVSANPGKEFESRVQLGYEAYTQQKYVEGMVSVPIAEGLAVRLVGYYSDKDGWFRNLAPTAARRDIGDQKDRFVRGTIRYDRGAGFDDTLKVSYARSTSNTGVAGIVQPFACPTGGNPFEPSPPFVSNCKIDRYTVIGDVTPAQAALNPLFGRPMHNQQQLAIINSANVEVGDNLTLSSVSTYYKSKEASRDQFSWTQIPYIFGANQNKGRQYTQEVRATSSYDGPVNFMAGGYYQNDRVQQIFPVGIDLGVFSGAPNGTNAILVDNRFTQKTEGYSVFGQVTFKVTSQVDFEIGGRYSHEKKKVTGEALSPSIISPVVGPLAIPVPQISFDDFSPQATLRYKPSANLMVYATYRTGFISGGYALNNSNGNELPYGQQKVKGGEVGAKGALFDRQVRYDLAAYYYKYRGLQLSAFDPQTISERVSNAASAEVYGLDASVQFYPRTVPGLSFRSGLAYTHPRYGTFLNAACYPGQSVAQGCNRNLVAGAFVSQDLSGTRLVRAADWFASLGATYERNVTDGLVASLSTDGSYRSSFNPLLQQDPRAEQRRSWLLDAALSLRASDSSWEVAVIGKNLTNTLRLTDANPVSFTGSGTGTALSSPATLAGAVSEPRSVLMQLTLRGNIFKR